ncbi:MAG TPA: hypothetical protein VNI54_07395 [Thermoanaerobaculia bacterium]|nr:hypothetical protein [Thermoanaerobaculia bacterium]
MTISITCAFPTCPNKPEDDKGKDDGASVSVRDPPSCADKPNDEPKREGADIFSAHAVMELRQELERHLAVN